MFFFLIYSMVFLKDEPDTKTIFQRRTGTQVQTLSQEQYLPEGVDVLEGGEYEPGTQLHVQVAPAGIGEPQGSV